VFGAWTAHRLSQLGKKVALLDAHGPANSRASSGGESRIIRMGYGPDEIYTRWSLRSLELWREFATRVQQPLFHKTGVLWIMPEGDPYARASQAVYERMKIQFEKLSRRDLDERYPQMTFAESELGILEPESGALMARRAVEMVVRDAVHSGAEYIHASVRPPEGGGRVNAVASASGKTISAEVFIFACGPWLPKVFPALLEGRIRPTRQEVFFFGTPPGDARFSPPALPVWIDLKHESYGFPTLDARGVKCAFDRHGPAFDPENGERITSAPALAENRDYLARRFPALKSAPVVESRVCQYENTSNGDFLIDRHPDFENVWLVGGGSGHGFKHGPALGEYVARLVTEGEEPEHRFSLAAKTKTDERAVF
jgi:glycine/D-amino acid oxidase-like deaminating enzyme